MKKIELEINDYRNRLEEYLLSIDGIMDVKIENKEYNFFVTITYDETKIFVERIEKEIKLYIDRINEPIVVSFNKFEDNDVIKEINIEDACCEYCMEGNIENLLQIDGIGSFSYNQDTNYINVSAKLGYNPDKISKEKLKEIEESLEA